jgi:NAD(P)-dependent dehydrogenase (short-subunit alcohol dehydrogenase family)
VERRFEDKVALVTGAASGIGRATAMAFASEGAKVVVADWKAGEGQETARKIKECGGQAAFVMTDVSQDVQVRDLVSKTLALYGRLDCAHNNAGIAGTRAKVAQCTEESWDQTLAVNLKGVWLCMKYEIPAMLAQGQGRIVNTSSVYGLLGAPRLSAYAASKHAVIGLTRSAALEYYRAGVRINAVCPGLIDTGMAEGAILGDPEAHPELKFSLRERLLWRGKKMLARSLLAARVPSRRPGTPEEVAQTVLWLCSDAASYISGQALPVDGGLAVS